MRESERAPGRVVGESNRQPDVRTSDGVVEQIGPRLASKRALDTRLVAAVQRQAGNRAAEHAARRARPVQRQAPPAPPAAAPADPAAAGIVVEETVADLRPEQMHRGEFVRQARVAAQEGAAAALGPLAEQSEAEVEATASRYAGQQAAQLKRLSAVRWKGRREL